MTSRHTDATYSFLTARWRNLVMLSYRVDPAALIDRVPLGTTLDSWQGKTFVTLVGFQFLDTKVLGAPMPFHQDFEEVNLRFYVRRVTDGDEVRPGVVFIGEVVPRPLVGSMARLLYREPYIVVRMKSQVTEEPAPAVQYQWQARGKWHTVTARGEGAGGPATAHSLEEFLTERPWGYNGKRGSETLEYRVDHPRWRIWNARDARVEAELVSLCGGELAPLLTNPASAIVADGSAVTIHWRTSIGA